MIERTEYLQRLLSWKDEMVIKVVTGLRRCGKSTLLRQYQNLLLDRGVEGAQIISINFEELENEPLLDYKALYRHIKDQLCPDKTTYIFLDEIQKVPSYEKVVDSLYVKPGVDIYISGSNSYMLSGDLATLLSGRYVELSMLPLSFREYCQTTKLKDDSAFADYMKYGGLPYLAVMEKTDEKAEVYLEGIYNTVIVKDIEERQNRRESETVRRKVTDISLLKNIAKFLAGSVGSPISIRSITDYLISSGRKVSPNTETYYVLALSESFIFYPAERYDIVGKQILKSNKKWYIVDIGLRNHILPRRNYDLGFTIENIVFLELLRRGYAVYIGKYETTEIDFVACRHGIYTYIQVTADLTSETTFEREMRPLRRVRDNYEKIVLTLDRLTIGNYDGIKVIHVIDWLLND
ncbi:MAG: ATP-binding protein [Lachnospiraceae bacterium]|nr:ATP-binding protein [Lachnospiraceae bacterium]